MQRLISVLTICTAILMSIGLGAGLTHPAGADAKEDPEAIFRGFVSALNNGDAAAAAALLDDNVTFFEPNGDGSFGAVGKAAFASFLPDVAAGGFEATIRNPRVHGDTVTGGLSTVDESSKGAGIDRYLETFTAVVAGGKLTSLRLRYDTSDAQTRTYIAWSASSGGDDEGPPPGTIEMTLGSGAHGSQPGTVSVFDGTAFGGDAGVTFVGVSVQPGQAGVEQTADLVSGSCDAPGKRVYPLAAVVDGESFTIISASVDELLAQGLSVQVHQVNQPDRVNACGAFAVPAAPAPPAPAPARTDIKPPATGTGPVAADGRSAWLLVAVAATGVLAVAAGVRVGRGQPR